MFIILRDPFIISLIFVNFINFTQASKQFVPLFFTFSFLMRLLMALKLIMLIMQSLIYCKISGFRLYNKLSVTLTELHLRIFKVRLCVICITFGSKYLPQYPVSKFTFTAFLLNVFLQIMFLNFSLKNKLFVKY